MNYKGVISLFAIVLIVVISLGTAPGCANIVPPQGGPRDSLPPVLLKATPGDSTRNFTGNKITFTFDEFVDLQNVQENLMVSPSPGNSPIVESKLNTVTVRLRDSLEANTTYSINFGTAIKDFNEGNPLKDFTYTFSTGRYIDSLELGGNVLLAENGRVDTTLIVILHTKGNDSAVAKDRPRYVVKLDNKGSFKFKNLPPGTFYLYALKDDGGTRRYLNPAQLFAFADKPVITSDSTAPVTLYAYAKRENAVSFSLPVAGSTDKKANRTGVTTVERLKFQTNVVSGQQDLLDSFYITFEKPLRMVDTSKIRLYTDSTFKPVSNYSFRKDSTNRKLLLTNTWAENTTYHIILDKDFAEDTAGKRLLKTDTVSFKTKKLADYGSLKLKFIGMDMAKNPVLLFVVQDRIIRSVPLTTAAFSQAVFTPGDYELRILYDENKNGIWDPGEFFGKHKQPELVKPVDRKVTVKPNWENEFDIQL